LLEACIAELSEAGVPVTGELLRSYGTHTVVAAAIVRRATELGAGTIVLGPETRHPRRAASTRTSRPMHRATSSSSTPTPASRLLCIGRRPARASLPATHAEEADPCWISSRSR
jgi:hypothetical protein